MQMTDTNPAPPATDITPLPKPPTGLARLLPASVWLPRYNKGHLGPDAVAGLTTAVMLIPQGMAYAMLAGLPPIVGLYASVAPIFVYALLGTSRQLAVGPVAMVSIMVAQGLAPIAEGGTEAFIVAATVLALMVGVIQLTMGLLRLGFIVNFISHPVVSGFTSAAALIIGLSQLKHLMGIDLPRTKDVFAIIGGAVDGLGGTDGATLAIALLSIAALVALKRFRPRWPRALLVVVVSTVAVIALSLGTGGVKTVGFVPAGLPVPSIPGFDAALLAQLAPIAIAIALVSFMESISVAKAFARKNHYDVDPNQELVALGAANLAAGVTAGYPVTGGFSRTAVNAQAGARSPLPGLFTAAIVALTLLFLTPLFEQLPKAALGAIIMTAVFGLVDLAEVKHLWQVKRSDLIPLVATFAATLAIGFEQGIAVGVGIALAMFLWRTTRPHVAVIGRLDGTHNFRNVKRYPEVETTPGVLAVRIDAQFYFGNVTFLKDTLRDLELATDGPVHTVVLDTCGVNQLDSSAEAALCDLLAGYRARGIQLVLADVKGPVRDVLKRSGLWTRLGPQGLAVDVHTALTRLSVESSVD